MSGVPGHRAARQAGTEAAQLETPADVAGVRGGVRLLYPATVNGPPITANDARPINRRAVKVAIVANDSERGPAGFDRIETARFRHVTRTRKYHVKRSILGDSRGSKFGLVGCVHGVLRVGYSLLMPRA